MIRHEERLATAIAHLILDPAAPPARHIAVGAASPIPAGSVAASPSPYRVARIAAA